jgi:hypothetical protein
MGFNSVFKGLKCRIQSRNNKLRMYRTVVRPVIRCAAETWSRDVKERNIVAVLKRNILRKITGPVKKNGDPELTRSLTIKPCPGNSVDGRDGLDM